ncbi:MAG: SelD-related putative sulfur metabolism protein [Nitrososphaeria archaeon]|nr:SelD-related putative sulfur metabolism protein [Nitrososphaeria archaeon]
MVKEVFEDYRKIGINSLELACGCAVKVDLDNVVYPSIKELRQKLYSNFVIPSKKDAEVVGAKREVKVYRRFYRLGPETNVDADDIRRIDPLTCVAVIQVFQRHAVSPEKFSELLEPVYKKISEAGVNLRFGKGHSIITTVPEESIAVFDFITVKGRSENKLLAINNDTVNIIDPTLSLEDERQVRGALCNALNDLYVLGVYNDIQVAPLVGAPNEDLRKKMIENVKKFSRENNFKFINVPQFDSRRLFIGATVLGTTEKQTPTREDLVQPGMQIIVTRPFGELSPLTVYISSLINDEIVSELESRGISFRELEKEKEEAVNLISSPNIMGAKIVNRYLPKIGEKFEKDQHVILSSDISGPGIYIFAEIAERANACIGIEEIPLLFPEVSEYAAKKFLMANSTAGTNGAFCIIAHKNVVEELLKDLRRAGYRPQIIGEVEELGRARVKICKSVLKYVSNLKHPLIEVGE